MKFGWATACAGPKSGKNDSGVLKAGGAEQSRNFALGRPPENRGEAGQYETAIRYPDLSRGEYRKLVATLFSQPLLVTDSSLKIPPRTALIAWLCTVTRYFTSSAP